MRLCGCFKPVPPKPTQDSVKTQDDTAQDGQRRLSRELVGGSPSVAFQAIHALRARLACTTPQSWASRLAESAALVAAACDAGLVGLLGLTVSESRLEPGEVLTTLVVLATAGPAAAALGIGELLPWAPPPPPRAAAPPPAAATAPGGVDSRRSPQQRAPPACTQGLAARWQPPMLPLPLPPWEPPPCLRHSSPHPDFPLAGECTPSKSAATAAAAAAAAASSGRRRRSPADSPRSWRQPSSGAPPPLASSFAAAGSLYDSSLYDEAWLRVLAGLQRALPPSGPARWHLLLLPLSLAGQPVGALLLALPAAAAAAAASVVVVVGGGGGGDGSELRKPQQERPPSMAAAQAATLHGGLLHHVELLTALGECVAECCLAPVLSTVEQVCGCAAALDSSTTLQELSAGLAAALTSSLSSDLHVDLGVRLALLPASNAPQGVLFDDAAARTRGGGGSAAAAGGGSGGAAPPVLHQRSPAVSFLAAHRVPGTHQQQQQVQRQQQQQQQQLLPARRRSMESAPGGYSLGGGGGAQQEHQRPHQPGCGIGGGGAGGGGGKFASSVGSGGGGGATARVMALQAEAARARAAAALEAAGGFVMSDDILLCPVPLVTHGSPNAGHLSGDAIGGLAAAAAAAAAGRVATSTGVIGSGRRAPSPLLAQSGRGQIRATTISMASTLAATLLSGAATAAAGTAIGGAASTSGRDSAASTGGGGGGRSYSGLLSYIGAPGAAASAAVAPFAVRLVGTVIANVHSYLQDAEKPTADVFAVLRRHGANPASTSLVAVAACCAATVAGGGGGGGGSSTNGGTAAAAATTRNGTGDKLPTARQLVRGLYGNVGPDGGMSGGGGSSTCLINTSGTTSMQLGPALDGGGSAGGGAVAAAPPAFVLYLTSTMPLPQQLLGAVRDRAMALLEVLLPTAARVMAGAVQDEWTYLCAQVMGGGGAATAAALGPFSAAGGGGGGGGGAEGRSLQRSCSSLGYDGANGTGVGMAGLRSSMAAAVAGLPPSPALAAAAVAAASTAAGLGARARYGGSAGGASGRTLAAGVALSPPPSGRRGSRNGDLPPSPYERSLQRMGTDIKLGDDGGGGGGGPSARALAAAAAGPRGALPGAGGASRSSTRYGAASPAAAASPSLALPQPHRTAELDYCHPLDTFQSSSGFLALAEDDDRGSGLVGGGLSGRGGGGGVAAAAAAGLLSTVLSDGRETAKATRQAQLDIMVSTFHTALSKARNDAGALGGLHAEDDIRDLRLVKTIGSGGCSVVLLGRLHAMPVAVKVILPHSDSDDDDDDDNGAREDEDVDDGGSYGGGERGGRRRGARGGASGGVVGDEVVDVEGGGGRVVVLPPSSPHWGSAPEPETARGGNGGAARQAPRPSPAARQAQMRLLMRGARELAVMTSISHPNIVQVYSYCTRVIVQELASGLPKLEVVPEGANVKDPICTALIMEYCDMGSLADAVDSGAFARAAKVAAAALHSASRTRAAQSVTMGRADRVALAPPPDGDAAAGSSLARGVDAAAAAAAATYGAAVVSSVAAATAGTAAMRAIYLTLLEVALALRHLHSLSLVHCDVKPANVLLRSSATDPRGFTAKLTDFGFVNLLEQRRSECGRLGALDGGGGGGCGLDGSAAGGSSAGGRGSVKFAEPVGTVTHMAPELFVQGHPVDSSIDVYAFGILMWELGTGRAPYAEYADGHFAEVPYRVVKEGLRPRFPSDTPLHYKLLAQECWSSQPGRRPTAAALVSRLQRLLDLSCGFTGEDDPRDAPAAAVAGGRGGGGGGRGL